jgi:protein gp37
MAGLVVIDAAGPRVAASGRDWYDAAWPIVRGCSPVSAGCDHCTAADMAEVDFPGLVADGHWNGRIELHWELLAAPARIARPLRWLVCPLSDLFHPRVPDAFLEAACAAMTAAPAQTFGLLTKRPARARRYFAGRQVPKNVWMGTSVETQAQMWRVAELSRIQAPLHWVSAEPLLGPVDLSHYLPDPVRFVAAGPEVGPARRPCNPTWMRDLMGACLAAGVPFFTKHVLDGETIRQVP